MKYLDTKEGSLEESISKAINEKPDSTSQPVESKEKDNLVESTAKELEEAGGKYLKYSDLLLQKGRMLAKNKNTAMIDKEIDKEKRKLGIKDSFDAKIQEMAVVMTEEEGDKEKYQKFFKSALKKFGVDSPADLDDDKKKEFFNYVDKNYKGDHEESIDLEEVNAFYVTDKDQGNRDFEKLMKKFKLKVKTLHKNVNPGYDEVKISGDKRDIDKMMKVTGEDDMYKFNPKTKEFELDESQHIKEYIQQDGSRRKVKEGDGRRKENKLNEKDLEKKLNDNVDETLDKIREANVEKGRTMRNILADIWKVNEGKSPFDNDKKEEQEDKPLKKTLTGKKTTKVEIEPEIK